MSLTPSSYNFLQNYCSNENTNLYEKIFDINDNSSLNESIISNENKENGPNDVLDFFQIRSRPSSANNRKNSFSAIFVNEETEKRSNSDQGYTSIKMSFLKEEQHISKDNVEEDQETSDKSVDFKAILENSIKDYLKNKHTSLESSIHMLIPDKNGSIYLQKMLNELPKECFVIFYNIVSLYS